MAVSVPAGAASNTRKNSSGTTTIITLGATAYNVGDAVTVVVVVATATTTGWSVTDNSAGGPNTWQADISPVTIGGSTCLAVFKCLSVAHQIAATTGTITVTHPTSSFTAVASAKDTGESITSSVDLSQGTTGTSTAPASGTSGTSRAPAGIVFGIVAFNLGPASGDSVTETLTGTTAGFTSLTSVNANGGSGSSARTVGLFWYYRIVSSKATYSFGGTLGHTDNWQAVALSYTALNQDAAASTARAPSITAARLVAALRAASMTRAPAITAVGVRGAPRSALTNVLPTVWSGLGRTNLVANGGFETDTSGWNGYSGTETVTQDTAWSLFSAASAKVVTSGATTYQGIKTRNDTAPLVVVSGHTYTVSVYVRGDGNSSANVKLFFDELAQWSTGGVPLSSTPIRLVLTFTASADFSTCNFEVLVGVDGAGVAATYWIDGAQFEEGETASPYIETNGATASRASGRVVAAVRAPAVTQAQSITATRLLAVFRAASVTRAPALTATAVRSATASATVTRAPAITAARLVAALRTGTAITAPSLTAARLIAVLRGASSSVAPSITATRLAAALRGASTIVTPAITAARLISSLRAGAATVAPSLTAARLVAVLRAGASAIAPSTSATRLTGALRGGSSAVTPSTTAARLVSSLRAGAVTAPPSITAARLVDTQRAAAAATTPAITATRLVAALRGASTIVTPAITAITDVVHPGVTADASVTTPPAITATRQVDTQRTASTAVVPAVTATRQVAASRAAAATLAVLTSAGRQVGAVRSAAINRAPAISAGRLLGTLRTASATVPVGVTAAYVRGAGRLGSVIIAILHRAAVALHHVPTGLSSLDASMRPALSARMAMRSALTAQITIEPEATAQAVVRPALSAAIQTRAALSAGIEMRS